MKSIIAICGSRRNGSFNGALLDEAVTEIRTHNDVSVDLVAGDDISFPLYEEDLETAEGIPDAVTALHDRIAQCSSVLVATPEYNGSYPPLFKNAFDWVSRVDFATFKDRHIGIMTASPGGGGGARSAQQTAELFSGVKANVYLPTFSLPRAHEAFAQSPISGLSEWVGQYLDDIPNDK